MHRHLQNVIRGGVVALALLGAACGGDSASSTPTTATSANLNPTAAVIAQQPTAQTSDLPLNAAGEKLVARVNETEITEAAFQRAIARFQQQQLAAADPAALRATVLDTLIEQALIEQAAADQDIAISETQIDAEIASYMADAGGQATWEQWLASNLYTEEEFRATLRDSYLTQQMRDQITQTINHQVVQVHARHILVSTEAQATEVLDRLAAGEEFAALALEYSRDVTTREQGGDLGWFSQEELLEPYLAQVAFSLQPGETAGPVPSSLGFHVIQTLERGERPIPEDKRANLAQIRFETWLDSLARNATIERYI